MPDSGHTPRRWDFRFTFCSSSHSWQVNNPLLSASGSGPHPREVWWDGTAVEAQWLHQSTVWREETSLCDQPFGDLRGWQCPTLPASPPHRAGSWAASRRRAAPRPLPCRMLGSWWGTEPMGISKRRVELPAMSSRWVCTQRGCALAVPPGLG